MMRNLIVGAL
uniref:Uncharacterized protein n=1 Tax=Arundo donax TaxID=35708 RepID=A0A0A9ER67_ARUDO